MVHEASIGPECMFSAQGGDTESGEGGPVRVILSEMRRRKPRETREFVPKCMRPDMFYILPDPT